MDRYNKAIAAILGGAVTVIGAAWGEDKVSWMTPEIVAGIGGVITTLLVFFFPANRVD